MIQIQGSSADELFINIARRLLLNGKYVSPRGLRTLELNDFWLTLLNPEKSIVTIPARKLNMDYLKAEMDWYKSGDLSVEEIGKHAKFWLSLQNPDGTVNSNYGFLAMKEKHNGRTQFEWCRDKLLEDKDTRQAVINYNQPRHKYEGNKDFVCTMTQTFRRNDSKLDTTVMMRSNDLIYGLSYDMPWFNYIQTELAKAVNLEPGIYNHFAASLHVYERHWGMLEEIAKSSIPSK